VLFIVFVGFFEGYIGFTGVSRAGLDLLAAG
jgi:hypothetical protein